MRDDQMPVEGEQVNHHMKIAYFLWNKKEANEEALWVAFLDSLDIPPSPVASPWPAIDLLPSSELGTLLASLLVGGKESHTNKTPDRRIFDDRPSPSRCFHCREKNLDKTLHPTLHCLGVTSDDPAFFLEEKGSGSPLHPGCLSACRPSRLHAGKKSWFGLACCPWRMDWRDSWFTCGPSLWWTKVLFCVADYETVFLGILKWDVSPR